MPHFVPLYYINSYIWFPYEQEIVRNNSFPPDSILSQIILIWLLWEGIYICKRKICSWMIKVGNDSFLQTQFGPKASETISQRRFFPKLFICKRKIHHKGRKQFFPTDSIQSKSVWNNFSEKVLPKLFICKRKIQDEGRKRFFPTVSIRSESVWNDFSEKVFAKNNPK